MNKKNFILLRSIFSTHISPFALTLLVFVWFFSGKPDTPEPPKADRVTRDSVTLSWRPPRHDGGSKIKGYIVQKKKKGDADWSDANISPVPNTLHTVSFVL